MAKVLIVGAGGVGAVVAHKCAQVPEVFTDITLASRTKSKCDAIAAQISRPIHTAQVDADNEKEMADLIRRTGAEMVINVALPYQDLHIMNACLETGVNYLDTANYEPPDEAKFCYKWQWEYQERFKKAGLMALLMRVQLISAENTFLAPDTYNGLFTMHGSTMMFLFAVPMLEGFAIYLLPLLLLLP